MGEHTNRIRRTRPPRPAASRRPAGSMMLMLVVRKMRKWRWFLRTMPAPSSNQGVADTPEEITAEFEGDYQEVKGRER